MSLLGAMDVTGRVRNIITSVYGALHVKTFPSAPRYISSTTLAVSTGSVALPAPIPPDAYSALIQVFTAAIYYDVDPNAAAPSATNGFRAYPEDRFEIVGHRALENFRALRQAADATLFITYYAETEE